MKIVSPIGILRIVCTVFGIAAIVIGVISGVYCRSFGIYRRGFMDRNHFQTQPVADEKSPPSKDFMRPYPKTNENDDPTRLHGCRAHPWENGEWDQHSFTLLMVYFIVVPLAFAISTSIFGFQIGQPERESCKKAVDLGLHAVCVIFTIVGGLCLIAAAVVPDILKQDDNKQDAMYEPQLKYQGNDVRHSSLERCLQDIDKDDYKIVYNTTYHKIIGDKFKKENSLTTPQIFKLLQKLGEEMYEAEVKNKDGDTVKIKDEAIKTYRKHNNFILRLVAGSINLVYGILLIALTVMIGLGLRKSKPKAQPIVELVPVVEEAPPPEEEEPEEGAEGGEDDSIAPVPSATASPPPEA